MSRSSGFYFKYNTIPSFIPVIYIVTLERDKSYSIRK